MTQTSPTPATARALIALVSVAGLAIIAAQVAAFDSFSGHDALALGLVVIAIILTDRVRFELPHGEDSEQFMLADAVWTAALLLTAAGVPTLGAAIGTAAWQLASRWQPRKVAFNVGQVCLALGLAEVIFGIGGTGRDPQDPTTWAWTVLAMAAASVVNFGAVALVISLVSRESFLRVMFGPWRVNLIQWLGNVTLGLLAAVLWRVSPWGLVLLGVPCVLFFLAYREWVRSTIEANQMEQMMKGAEAIARERAFGARLPVGERSGRLPELAVALNHMLDQLELAFRRQRQLMADVAGQLRRPIGDISRAISVAPAAPAHPAHPAGPAHPNGTDAPVTAPATPATNGAVAHWIDGTGSRELASTLDQVGRVLDDMAEIGGSQLPGFVEPRSVDVAELVEGIGRRAEPFLGDRLHTVGPAPSTTVRLDRGRIEQALLRLLQNTADHASGPVGLRTTQEERAILFEVVDEGGGVPAGHEEAIFEPFYRAGNRQHGGGLGLALVRTVAEAHGGSAGVVNRPGAGVTFWLRVPR